MKYQLNKQVTPKKTSSIGRIITPVLIAVMIPVGIIAFLSSLLVSFLVFLKTLISKKEPDIKPYHEELLLIDREQLKIYMVEDEADEELNLANDSWAEKVFGQHTYLYRVRTIPVIKDLNDSICGYYLFENNEGAFMQQLSSTNSLSTRMLFLDYNAATVTAVGDVGAFYLYNDKETNLIRGFNEDEEILIGLEPV